MTQNETLTSNLALIGEDIGPELGAKMVKDFQDAFPNENQSFNVGRNIIDKILQQPNCLGIRIYNALNESGQKTLVIVGLDSEENIICEYSTINPQGIITNNRGIVADRVVRPGKDSSSTSISYEWWA